MNGIKWSFWQNVNHFMVKEYEPLLIFIEDHIFDKILLYGSFHFLFMSLEYIWSEVFISNRVMIIFQNSGDLCFLHGIYICSLFRTYVGKILMVQRRIWYVTKNDETNRSSSWYVNVLWKIESSSKTVWETQNLNVYQVSLQDSILNFLT